MDKERPTTDHDRLIRVDERGERMERDIAEIKEWMANRAPCPSNLCGKHEGRISTLEDHEKIVIGVIVVGVPVMVFVLNRIFG